MTVLTAASHQWSSRPDDQRFVSLHDMLAHFESEYSRSRATVVSSRKISAMPDGTDHKGLALVGPSGDPYNPTHWAFGQLAALAEAPAIYLRSLPSEIAADCLNYGLLHKRKIESVGLLLYRNGKSEVRAATGPRYGRIWNREIVGALVNQIGDGATGEWKVPGEFRRALKKVTKKNTTLFASDRDMFVFLANEKNCIELPNRRNGKPGTLFRGFFVWNSEVGSSTFGVATFLYDEVCQNRLIWGAQQYVETRIRHTVSAPDKWIEEVRPALMSYANSSTKSIKDGIANARKARIEDIDEFLSKRFSKRIIEPIKATHISEEGRPIENLWDASTAITAYARGVTWQDERVKMERQAGEILDLVATKA